MIHLDFESRSEANIWDTGAWAYSMHPSTDVLCIAYAIDNQPVQLITRDDIWGLSSSKCLTVLLDELKKDHLICAHNAFFEQCIWHNVMVRRYNWPKIKLNRWWDTMAKANAHSLPRSLSECGSALKLSVQKDMTGRRVMMKMAKPRKATKADSSSWHNDPQDYLILHEYCKLDVKAEREIEKALPDLIEPEQEIWLLDQKINHRGIQIDIDAVNSALYLIESYTEKLGQEAQTLSNGHLNKVSQRLRVLNWVNAQGIQMPGYTKADIIETLKRKDLPPKVRRILEIRQQLGKTSVAKYTAMKNALCPDGRIRDTLMYHGASTGRWTGKLVQLQNIPKSSIKDVDNCISLIKKRDLPLFELMYDDVMGAISSSIRSTIIAKPKHKLYVADYNAIEARVVLWLSNDRIGLNKFKKGEDLYVDMAQIIYKKTSINPNERQLGKAAILGCGYGMGANKFFNTCLSWGIKIDPELAEHTVRAYRTTYSKVKEQWYEQERAAIRAILTKKIVICGKVKWQLVKNFLYCKLPSGRCLSYPYPRLHKIATPWGDMKDTLHFKTVNSITRKWEEQTTYGGKLVENITQAIARDLLAAAMVRLERSGYPIVLSVHDELIAEVPDGTGSIQDYIQRMEDLPQWATDCPIKAEGWVSERYKK